ncbi:hypothetical protein EVAR_4226_1 [Eumeta japonica]|uniref:Uncharacterized protein n=1 Tax=Eumeta variegata TaxID=151549 RepID=A0A4C1TJ68_EUMVA|nr:hypothetical protein EVAR_4226_1 [Eumeta japonica]
MTTVVGGPRPALYQHEWIEDQKENGTKRNMRRLTLSLGCRRRKLRRKSHRFLNPRAATFVGRRRAGPVPLISVNQITYSFVRPTTPPAGGAAGALISELTLRR